MGVVQKNRKETAMKTKTATMIGSALVLAMGLGGVALAAGPDGMMPRGERGAQMFQQFDTDGDGNITRAEIDAAAAARFAAADTDGDGFLSAEELAAHAAAMQAERHAAGSQRMMERLDADKDGKVSAAEMAAHSPARMFDRLDADEDGAITRDEMAGTRMMHGHGDRQHAGKMRGDHGDDGYRHGYRDGFRDGFGMMRGEHDGMHGDHHRNQDR
jgi:Ca2+-binding EF-hand superfamily protein